MEYGTWYCKIGNEPKLRKLTIASIIEFKPANNWVSVFSYKLTWYGKLIKVLQNGGGCTMLIYMSETQLIHSNEEQDDNFICLGNYTRERFVNYILEFPDLKHDLPTYHFMNSLGEVLSTMNLVDLANLHSLDNKALSRIHNNPGKVYKGWIKAPLGFSDDKEANKLLFTTKQNNGKEKYRKFSINRGFEVISF